MATKRELDALMKAPYTRMLVQDEDGVSATVREMPGCFSSGATAAEAAVHLEEAMRLWFEVELSAGHALPEPTGVIEYSGKVLLRLPASLHQRAAQRAELEGTSLNQLLVAAVAQYLGEVGAVDRVVEALQSAGIRGLRGVAESSPEYRQ